jgi:lysophospholipase L1-like esterase
LLRHILRSPSRRNRALPRTASPQPFYTDTKQTNGFGLVDGGTTSADLPDTDSARLSTLGGLDPPAVDEPCPRGGKHPGVLKTPRFNRISTFWSQRRPLHDRRRLLLALFMRCWLAYQQADNNQWSPRPRDATTISTAGPDPDRVLIFGSGPAVGWGVLTNEIALPGSLARALTRRTRCGTQIELVADMRITVINALPMLRAIDTSRFDVIVLVLGANDAAKLMPLQTWQSRLFAVLSALHQKSSSPSRIFVTGIPPIDSVPGFKSRVGMIVAAHARQMNTITARMCNSALNATYVPLSTVEPTNALGVRDGQTYRKWADAIADVIAPQLDQVRSRKRTGTFDALGWAPDGQGVASMSAQSRAAGGAVNRRSGTGPAG